MAPDAQSTGTKEGAHLVMLAWVVAVLALVFAFLRPAENPTIAWVFVVVAVISVACSLLALSRSKDKASGRRSLSPVVTLLLSLGILVMSVMGILAQQNSEQAIVHSANGSTLSCLEVMMESYYARTEEYPSQLSDLKQEAKLFPDTKVEDFLSYVNPKTGEGHLWVYQRANADEFTIKTDKYQFEGNPRTLVLRGKGDELVQEEEGGE